MSASTCAACGFANSAGARFCGSCGSPLGKSCANCGAVNPPELSFCTSCGAALDSDDERGRGSEERKVVSVLFADLVGFTTRSEGLDPEDVGQVQTPYFAAVRSEIENYGGTLEKYIGDAVMAVFGAPVAHEDDPARAVLAALAVRDAIAELNSDNPLLGLRVRIGITTGEVLVRLDSRPERGEGIAAGDVVNTAARLQSAAPIDGILVDDGTRRASERIVEFRKAQPVSAKGKSDPVPVWEALTRIGRLGVDIAFRGRAPLVGRGEELAVLRDALARIQRERTTQLVTLVGLPGIGKSRLVWELYQAVHTDPDQLVAWRQGRSLPYGEGVAYWALGEIIKAHAGILETDDAHAAEQKLSAAVEAALADASEARWVEGHVRPLTGLSGGPEPSAQGRSEAFAAWRRLLEAIAEDFSLVLVFEDLHWADDDLLDFIDHLAEWTSGVPLLIVCTTRPELLDRRPGWGGGKRNATTVSLSPLSEEETSTLLTSLLENGRVADPERRELLVRSGGNPLYAEEYVRMLDQAQRELPLPDSVLGIIAARLDTLPGEEKTLLQAAAIVGKVFWPGALGTMLDLDREEVEWRLRTLERKEFVRRERRSSVAGEVPYVFRHDLVRDVAAGQITRIRRAELHRLAAEWIDSLAGDRPEDLADMVAHHYSSALDLATSASQDVGDLPERARVALKDAADRALALNAFPAAARFYEQALALWPEVDSGRPRVLLSYGRALFQAEGGGKEALREAAEELLDAGELEDAARALLDIADLLFFVEGDGPEAIRQLDLAVSLLTDSPPSAAKASVLANRARFHMIGAEADKAIALAREAQAMADELGLEDLRAHILVTLGGARTMAGDLDGIHDMEESVAIAPPHSFERMRALNNLAATLTDLGELERASEFATRSLEEARQHGHTVAIAWIETQELDSLYWQGAWDELVRRADAALAMEGAGSPTLRTIDASILRARVRVGRGDRSGALDDSKNAVGLARAEGDPQILFPALATRALVLLRSDQPEEAEALAAELLGKWTRNAASMAGPWVVELAWVLEALGHGSDLADAAAASSSPRTGWLVAALELAAGDAAAAADGYERMGALADAAITRLRAVEHLLAAGRRDEAEAQLALARPFLRSVDASAYLEQVDALLEVS